MTHDLTRTSILLGNLAERAATDPRLQQLLTECEITAIGAAAALLETQAKKKPARKTRTRAARGAKTSGTSRTAGKSRPSPGTSANGHQAPTSTNGSARTDSLIERLESLHQA